MPIYKQTESFQTKLELGTSLVSSAIESLAPSHSATSIDSSSNESSIQAGAGDSVGRVSINLSMAKSLESRIDSTISFCPSITCCLSFDLEWPSVLSIPKHAGLRNGSPKCVVGRGGTPDISPSTTHDDQPGSRQASLQIGHRCCSVNTLANIWTINGKGYVSSPWHAISTPIDGSTESYGSNAKVRFSWYFEKLPSLKVLLQLQLALKQLLLEQTPIKMQFHKSFIAFILTAILSTHALPTTIPVLRWLLMTSFMAEILFRSSRPAIMDQASTMALAVDVPLKLIGMAQVPVMLLAVAVSWKLITTVQVLTTTLTMGVIWRLAIMVQALITDVSLMLTTMVQAPTTIPTIGVNWRLATMALVPIADVN
ncbi:hypothetical protein CPB84DRAFT_1841965 [Gymnopilus junonius]|uniref:Uncharacterized protein n=1 Tax=Gymnopilus junonius TaxID=109634 RepID=A0A9P5NZ21_GYMJU|nr:hypothetical protein CPB84DRAFT_1841965 [Gymnopilus junonius]